MSIEISSSSAGGMSASDVSSKGRGGAAAGKGNFLDLLMRLGEQDLAGLVLEAGQGGAKEGDAVLPQAAQGDKKGPEKSDAEGAAVAALQAWMAAHQPDSDKTLPGISLGPVAGQKDKDGVDADGIDVLAGVLAGLPQPALQQGVLPGARGVGEAVAKGIEPAGKGMAKGRSQTQLLQKLAVGGHGVQAGAVSTAEQVAGQTTAQLAAQSAAQLQPSAHGRGEGQGRGGAEIAGLVHELKAAGAGELSLAAPGASGFRQVLADAGGAGRPGGPEAAWGLQALVSDRMTDVSTVAAEEGATPSAQESAVADQVSYWIANDIQKAELRLDPWGRDPVEVSLFVQGNEARVEFRADVPEVRQMLEGALAQLQSALQDQGLVLAEASVGQFGTGGAGQREQSARQGQPGARQGTARVEAASTGDIPRVRVSSTGERSVDVFV